jgi:glycine oxidase
MHMRHIGIAGAGLLGRLLAFFALERGHRVTLFDIAPDLQTPGAAAWTAAGMLSPLAELECADATVMNWGLQSLEQWPRILAHLPKPVDFHRQGSLLLAHPGDQASAQQLLALIARRAPDMPPPRPLDHTSLAHLEPALCRTQSGLHAWLLEGEGHIHTVQAMQALGHYLITQGVCFQGGQAVEVDRDSPCIHTPLCGRTEKQSFDHVFDVRGCGTAEQQTGMSGVRGVRGEIFWLHAPGIRLLRPLRLLHPRHRVYLVPRPGDVLLVGASEIESEDRSPVSVRTTLELLSAAYSLLPGLAEARIIHQETNLRPALPDNLPRIEHGLGCTRINGLFRHGWLIAPALARQAWMDVFS